MAQDSSSNRPMPENYRRDRTKFTKEQLKILIDTFNQMPYPGYATRRRLALEINTEESRIHLWFNNRRARYPFRKREEQKESLESSQDPGQDHFPEQIPSEQVRQCRTIYSRSQLHTLIKAFRNNPYPGIHCREQLAEDIGVPESKVQTWFQNRRSRLGVQGKKKYRMNPLDKARDKTKKKNLMNPLNKARDKTCDRVQDMEDTQNGTNFSPHDPVTSQKPHL